MANSKKKPFKPKLRGKATKTPKAGRKAVKTAANAKKAHIKPLSGFGTGLTGAENLSRAAITAAKAADKEQTATAAKAQAAAQLKAGKKHLPPFVLINLNQVNQ